MSREDGEQETRADGTSRFRRETGMAAEVASVAEPLIENLGFRLVRVEISGRDGQTVQVMAERSDGTLTIEDCEAISRDLSVLLDTCDPVSGSYRLEVSSPGIDRPLVRVSDFTDWQGYEARLELSQAVSGRKRWRGELLGYEDGEVRMEVDIEGMGRQVVGFPLALVETAKLMLTDDLVREALRSANQDRKKERKQARGRKSGATGKEE
jgi:ribosome maturation factor RimP